MTEEIRDGDAALVHVEAVCALRGVDAAQVAVMRDVGGDHERELDVLDARRCILTAAQRDLALAVDVDAAPEVDVEVGDVVDVDDGDVLDCRVHHLDISLARDLGRDGQLLVALKLARGLLYRLDAPRRCERILRGRRGRGGRDVRGLRGRLYEELGPRGGLEDRRRDDMIREHTGVFGREGVARVGPVAPRHADGEVGRSRHPRRGKLDAHHLPIAELHVDEDVHREPGRAGVDLQEPRLLVRVPDRPFDLRAEVEQARPRLEREEVGRRRRVVHDVVVVTQVLVLDAGECRQLGGGDDLAQLLAVRDVVADACERRVDGGVQVGSEAGRGDGVHLRRDALASTLEVLEGRVLDRDRERVANEEVGFVAGHRRLAHSNHLHLGHSRRHA